MTPIIETLLADQGVVRELAQAWRDSMPGETGGIENGGFIVQDTSGKFLVLRWLPSSQDEIYVPQHDGCKVAGVDIVATLHTHPTTGADAQQEPSKEDITTIRDDPDLKGNLYVGEFVISTEKIYLISPDGVVSEVSRTEEILGV